MSSQASSLGLLAGTDALTMAAHPRRGCSPWRVQRPCWYQGCARILVPTAGWPFQPPPLEVQIWGAQWRVAFLF